MLNAKSSFLDRISKSRDLFGLYDFLSKKVPSPFDYDDLLRYQTVQIVSAFDKLIHDLIRIGMLDIYKGLRTATERYHAEPISISLHSQLITASFPPKEILFEQEVVRKLSYLSFQDPSKIADGLSLIWSEKRKWAKICKKTPYDDANARVTMKLIVARRNSIVHEADVQPLSGDKTPIMIGDCKSNTDFIEKIGESIANILLAS